MIIIGHRGAQGYEPENTLRAIRKAIEHQVDAVEFDVYALDTEELILMHDHKVDRTTDGSGYTKTKTLEQIKKLDAGKGESVPTLREALDLINRRFFRHFFNHGSRALGTTGTTIGARSERTGTAEGTGVVLIGHGLLGLHAFDILEGQVIGLQDDATEDVFGKLNVALDAGNLGAFALEEREDIDATLLAADFIGQAAFIPLADVEDFRVGTVEDVLHFGLGGIPGAGGVGGVEEEKGFVLTGMGCHLRASPNVGQNAASDATASPWVSLPARGKIGEYSPRGGWHAKGSGAGEALF